MGPQSPLIGLVAQPWLACGLLFFAMLASIEIGWRLGRANRTARDADTPGTGAIDGAIFALLGLVMAFSFSGAAQRFDARRDLIVTEANAIGTAYMRIDLVAAEAQPELRRAFARYVDSRVTAYAQIGDANRFAAGVKASGAIGQQIWSLAIAAGRRPDAAPAVNIVLLPAINDMIDLTATRAFATLMHPPAIIHYMLIILALISGVLAGTGLATGPRRVWLHPISFSVIMTMAIYITIDLEYPRAGFIRVDNFETAVIGFTRGN